MKHGEKAKLKSWPIPQNLPIPSPRLSTGPAPSYDPRTLHPHQCQRRNLKFPATLHLPTDVFLTSNSLTMVLKITYEYEPDMILPRLTRYASTSLKPLPAPVGSILCESPEDHGDAVVLNHDAATRTLRRRVNARRESARIAAEAEKHGIRGTSCTRTRAQARHTCSRISRRKLRKSRFRLGGGLDGFFK